jgi:DNA-binding winged helix-turn-helix (wHTH) protein
MSGVHSRYIYRWQPLEFIVSGLAGQATQAVFSTICQDSEDQCGACQPTGNGARLCCREKVRVPGSRIVRFGQFIAVLRRELHRNRLLIKLQKEPFQVLAILLERAGELTREELRVKLWPKDTFLEFEHGFNAAVKRLRNAPRKSADTPIFILPVARCGCCFIVACLRGAVLRVTRDGQQPFSGSGGAAQQCVGRPFCGGRVPSIAVAER